MIYLVASFIFLSNPPNPLMYTLWSLRRGPVFYSSLCYWKLTDCWKIVNSEKCFGWKSMGEMWNMKILLVTQRYTYCHILVYGISVYISVCISVCISINTKYLTWILKQD